MYYDLCKTMFKKKVLLHQISEGVGYDAPENDMKFYFLDA